MKTVFLTGATGVMGRAALDTILARGDRHVRLLVRDSKKNRKLLKPYLHRDDCTVTWGDLLDPLAVDEAMGPADIVLHLGGMVSPMADRFPEKTMRVNVGGTQNVVDAALRREREGRNVRFVYIGSVAQMSLRNEPLHWGRSGDPLVAAEFDHYGVSKIKAEWVVAESGLKRWVSLRQTGILHQGLFLRGSDPITFHVPLRGALEWVTVEDSGRLMAAVCGDDVPEELWRNFYNIGGGREYRLSNYEFERLILGAIGSPAPEKIFDTDWFATRNFHGCWYLDSDRLEELLPFRANVPVETYMRQMVRKAPWWARLAPLAPAPVVKRMMRRVARTKDYGTLDWIGRTDCEDRIRAFFGSRKERDAIPGWKDFDLSRPSEKAVLLSHGYDESKADALLGPSDFEEAAAFRGGKCLGPAESGDAPAQNIKAGSCEAPALDVKMEWECGFGHRFTATPRTVLKGGHWCPLCLPSPWRLKDQAERSPFLAQVIL